MKYREFVETVGRRAGVEQQHAEAASKAVVQALIEQVSPQRAHGLVDQLPRGLHPDVEEGTAAPARSLGEFYHRVGDLEGPDGADRDRDAKAVLDARQPSPAGHAQSGQRPKRVAFPASDRRATTTRARTAASPRRVGSAGHHDASAEGAAWPT